MGMYSTFETDNDLENSGVIVDYGDFRVRIAHAGQSNSAYVKYAEKKLKPVRRALDAGALGTERSQAIMRDIYIKTIILGWEVPDGEGGWKSGIESRNGIVPATEENIEQALKDLPALFLDIQEQANSLANFRKVELEEEAKN